MTELPLSARVPTAGDPAISAVDGITWRPATRDDIDAIAEVARAVSLVDHPNYVESREEIEEVLTFSWVDLANDSMVAIDSDGAVVAYGVVELSPSQETLVRSSLNGGVIPTARARGIGRALLAWQEQRALQQLSGSDSPLPGWVQLHADARAVASVRLVESAGFAAARWFRGMDRMLDEQIPALALPEALELRQLDESLSEAARMAKNASFRDHWGSQPTPREAWDVMMAMETMRRDLSWVAMDGDAVAGLVLTFVNEDDWPLAGYSSGYIGLVGVIREWRRKGVAPALLATAMESYRAAGLERACLDVDSANPSGAGSLYTGMGFFETTTSMAYTKVY
jgi:mycothiol synthase